MNNLPQAIDLVEEAIVDRMALDVRPHVVAQQQELLEDLRFELKVLAHQLVAEIVDRLLDGCLHNVPDLVHRVAGHLVALLQAVELHVDALSDVSQLFAHLEAVDEVLLIRLGAGRRCRLCGLRRRLFWYRHAIAYRRVYVSFRLERPIMQVNHQRRVVSISPVR